jgi:hypothetical protein
MTSSNDLSQLMQLPTEIQELELSLQSLPGEVRLRLEPLIGRVVESSKRRKRVLQMVQEALSQLRLDMKYLMFDLEATRRERDDYRQRLQEMSE